jgi:hypothetical protein
MRKRLCPRSGAQPHASVDLISESMRELMALAMLNTGKISAARVAIDERIQLPIERVELLAEALAEVKARKARKYQSTQRVKCQSAS